MICLTFDTDWMTEASLERFLRECPIPGRATFFCHDAFQCLSTTDHELCPHPFVSDLQDWQGELQELRSRISPGSTGIRTHSCVFSHAMAVGLHDLGFTYISQAASPFQPGLAPFRHPWGIWELPIYYMDNMDFWFRGNWPGVEHTSFDPRWIKQAVMGPDLYVFDFHPIHLALNTQRPGDYQRVKDRIVQQGVSPFELTLPGRGAREYFRELCAAMNDSGLQSVTCSEAVARWPHRQSVLR
jgi:hypothetical protein